MGTGCFLDSHEKKFCLFCSSRLRMVFVDGRLRPFCFECGVPLYENPVPAACVVLTDNLDNVLLVKRKVDPRKGSWCLPGGFMEMGETSEQTARRELKEETGLDGEIDSLLGVLSSNEITAHSIVVISYLVRHFSGVLTAGDDASEVNFFDPNQMPEIAFGSHQQFISRYYSNKQQKGLS